LPFTAVIELRDSLDASGRRPIRRWLDDLDSVTRARVAKALVQLSLGSVSEVKSIGGGVLERRLECAGKTTSDASEAAYESKEESQAGDPHR
jgi:hypothetical protein